MNEKAISVFEQYEVEPRLIFKQRGNYGCKTETGRYLLMEYDFSEEKLNTLFQVQEYLEQRGIKTEKIVPNREGHFISVGADGFGYAMKKIYPIEECDIQNREQIMAATITLGKIHKLGKSTEGVFGENVRIYEGKNLFHAFRKHNKELIHIRNYITRRKNKNFLERDMLNMLDEYYRQGQDTLLLLEQSTYTKLHREACERKQLIHGNYNQHALGFDNQTPVLVNMTRLFYGPPINDVYSFTRKVLEKNNWEIKLGHEIIEWYESILPLTKEEKVILKNLLSYPEKFWKIVNYYYNSNKAWYSEKNEEKLRAFQNQEEKRWNFINSL